MLGTRSVGLRLRLLLSPIGSVRTTLGWSLRSDAFELAIVDHGTDFLSTSLDVAEQVFVSRLRAGLIEIGHDLVGVSTDSSAGSCQESCDLFEGERLATVVFLWRHCSGVL